MSYNLPNLHAIEYLEFDSVRYDIGKSHLNIIKSNPSLFNTFECGMLVIANIFCIFKDHNKDSAETNQWLKVDFTCSLNDDIQNFRILNVDLWEKDPALPEYSFTDRLLLHLKKEKVDVLADEILAEYFQEAENVEKIDIFELVNRLNLKVVKTRLYNSKDVYGKMLFRDTYLEIETENGVVKELFK